MGFLRPSTPSAPAQQAAPPPVQEIEPEIEQRDLEGIDKGRRKRQQQSLLQLIGDLAESPISL